MKPVLTLGEKTEVVTMATEKQVDSTSGKQRRLTPLTVGIAVAMMFCIAGTAIGFSYLGSSLCKGHVKESWVAFYSKENPFPIKEKFRLGDGQMTITRPGVFTMVVDYKQKLVITQLDTKLDGDEGIKCYVTDLDEEEFRDFGTASDRIEEGRMNITVPYDTNERRYRSTGEHVRFETLSDSARDLCFGATIVRMKRIETQETSRVRRGWDCTECTIKCEKTCVLFFCTKTCWTECKCSYEEDQSDLSGPLESPQEFKSSF